MAIGQLNRVASPGEAEFALLVADRHQGQGLGTELLRRLLTGARGERYRRVVGHVLPENGSMHRVCRKLGFRLSYADDDRSVRATWEPSTIARVASWHEAGT